MTSPKNTAIMYNELKFDQNGLIPAIVTDKRTGEVLMQAYMNKESLEKTIETGKVTFWSRSRQALWTKGETSGNFLNLCEIRVDCDADSLQVIALPEGPACHTGNRSCFYRKIEDGKIVEAPLKPNASILNAVFETVTDRKNNPKEGSYTNYLFDKGIDKILKKVGEENAEVIIAAKNNSKDEVQYEVADLFYHIIVMLVNQGMCLEDIYEELLGRYGK